MSILAKILNFFVPAAKAETVVPRLAHGIPDPTSYTKSGAYKGIRHEIYTDGKLVYALDTRILEEEKKIKIREAKAETQDRILTDAPLHKQLNAANGLLKKDEADAIKNSVAKYRAWGNIKEIDINQASTLQDLEKINLKEQV